MIKLENVSFSYRKGEKVLDNINLTIEKGSFTAVIGPNGSGKSTMARHFNALLKPTLGAVYINGINTRDEERVFDIRESVGMVFQNPDNQLVAATVEDEAAFAPENLGVPSEEIRRRVDAALKTVGLSDLAKRPTSSLSGGQKQRLAIAATLTMEPECIVFDEATSMLDPVGRAELLGTIHTLNNEKGITVILITHYMDEAAKADRVIVLDKGKIALDSSPGEVFKNVEYLRKIGLGAPQLTELSYELGKSGIILSDTDDVQRCADALTEILGGARG